MKNILWEENISSAQWAPLSDTFTFKFSSYTTAHISHRQFHRVMIRQWMKCSQQLYDSSWKSHLRPLVHAQNINSFNLYHCFMYRQQIFSLSLKRPMIEVSLSHSLEARGGARLLCLYRPLELQCAERWLRVFLPPFMPETSWLPQLELEHCFYQATNNTLSLL